MSQGMGKAPSTTGRRRSADDQPYDRSPLDPPHSAPSSSFDASIPFNLPPRRSMKMLKDGSDFVWPESAHSLFVRGLQAWKYLNIGSKRTRAPRGEGKTDFLVRYLESHGVERTKKQVASHLQVLRTEWRNSDNTVLLSLVDDTVPHTRSLSEPSLVSPFPSRSNDSPPNASSFFNPMPDHGDDRAISTPSLPSAITALPPPPISSSLYHPAHDVYGSSSQLYPGTITSGAFHSQAGANIGSSWQLSDTVWNTVSASVPNPDTEPTIHHPVPIYDPPATFHDYDRTPRPAPPSALEPRGFSSEYYVVPGRGDAPPSSSIAAPLAQSAHQDTGSAPYGAAMYNPNPSYPALSQAAPPQPHNVYGTASLAYAAESYQYGGGGAGPQAGTEIAAGSTSPYGDAVEPAFLAAAQQAQQSPPHPHAAQWARPPATARYADPPRRRTP